MTKTLTEQWREGKLPIGKYYIKTKWWGCDGKWHYEKEEDIDYLDGDWRFYQDDAIVEVLAPVPSYEEYLKWWQNKDYASYMELWEDNAKLTRRVEKMKLLLDKNTSLLKKMQDSFDGQEQKTRLFEKQLNEANEILDIVEDMYPNTIKAYFKKWGVK